MAGETTDQGAALLQSQLIYLSLGVLPVVMPEEQQMATDFRASAHQETKP